jgi:hypothetical protein
MARPRTSTVLIGSAAALVLVAGGTAAAAAVGASSPFDSSGVIHGCWLSNAHSAGAVITGQGWQAQMTGNALLTVLALCAK